MEYDATYVAINDVYYRRLFIPVMISILLFIGVFLIIRGSPGLDYNMAKTLQFGGKLLRQIRATK